MTGGGFSGQGLDDLVAGLEAPTVKAGQRMAERMQRRGRQLIRMNTPVETHHLRESYRLSKVRYEREMTSMGVVAFHPYAWTGSVWTEVHYAPYVELGTGLWGPRRRKYKIEPKTPGGTLAFRPYAHGGDGSVVLDVLGKPTKSGQLVHVRFVMHPGSPGNHMFQIGTTMAEHEVQEWANMPLLLWKAEVETRIGRAA